MWLHVMLPTTGTYSEGGSIAPCRSCPGDNMTSKRAATSESDCFLIKQQCPSGSVSLDEYSKLAGAGMAISSSSKKAPTATALPAAVSGAGAWVRAAAPAPAAGRKRVRVYRQVPPDNNTTTPQRVPPAVMTATVHTASHSDGDAADDYTESNYYYAHRDKSASECVCKPGCVCSPVQTSQRFLTVSSRTIVAADLHGQATLFCHS